MVTTYLSIKRGNPFIPARFQVTMRWLCLALVCASGPAQARDYGTRDVGGWTIVASKDGKGCFLNREYERRGGTTVLLGLNVDGTNRLSLLNANWSIKPKDQLKLDFRLSNSSYPAHFAIGIVSEGKQGFVTSFGTKFPSYFASSKILQVSRGDVGVERLGLDGVRNAVAELRKCVAAQRDKPAATPRAKAQSDDIPKDPFAVPSPRESRK